MGDLVDCVLTLGFLDSDIGDGVKVCQNGLCNVGLQGLSTYCVSAIVIRCFLGVFWSSYTPSASIPVIFMNALRRNVRVYSVMMAKAFYRLFLSGTRTF